MTGKLFITSMSIMISATATLFAEEVTDESLATQSVANWPQWRGPTWNGVAPHADPPVRWSERENLRWKTPVAGRGHSTPIVWGERIFLITAIPIDKRLPKAYSIPADTPRINEHNAVIKSWKSQALVLICLDRATGQQRWQKTVREVMPHQGSLER